MPVDPSSADRLAGTAPEATDRPVLALDSGSPLVSVAVAAGGRVLAERSVAQERSSVQLLPLIAAALAAAGCGLRDLAGIVALQGPGSFTGLRVGLATALGLHQAGGVPATAWPSFKALAPQAPPGPVRVVALIDALRGEWFAQPFGPGPERAPIAGPTILSPAGLAELADCFVGFGATTLAPALPGALLLEPTPLATVAARLASASPPSWEAHKLSQPLYLRQPAVTPLTG